MIFPPAGFHFKVEFQDLEDEDVEVRFQSVTGLTVDIQTESLREGGEHRFEHQLPLRSKYSNLILKRGLVSNSSLIQWCRSTFQSLIVQPKSVLVKLLNEQHDPLMSWNIVHAWPKKWSVSEFNAEQNSLVIETPRITISLFHS